MESSEGFKTLIGCSADGRCVPLLATYATLAKPFWPNLCSMVKFHCWVLERWLAYAGRLLGPLAIIGGQADILRLVVSRKAVIQVERRVVAVQRTVEGYARIESVQRHAAAPARIERLRVEDAVARAHHGLVAYRVRQAQSRGESAIPLLFRIPHAGARRAPVIPGVHYAARKVSGAGVCRERKERHEIVAFPRR